MMDVETRRALMVQRQIAARGVRDEAVLAAMAAVPREAFLAPELAEFAYDDTPLPIPHHQTISQPYVVAFMAEALLLTGGERVLEIGTGSGYAAAVLACVAGEVYTVERHAELADQARRLLARLGYSNVRVLRGDGTLGWPEHAPYDGIVVTAGGPEVPQALLDQLASGGRLVMPVGRDPTEQMLQRLTRLEGGGLREEDLGGVRFVPLIGAQGWPGDGNGNRGPPTTPNRCQPTDRGSHLASRTRDGPTQVRRRRVRRRPGLEREMGSTGASAFPPTPRRPCSRELAQELSPPRLERRLGLVYRSSSEWVRHSLHASLPRQLDEVMWIEPTSVLRPVEMRRERASPAPPPFSRLTAEMVV